jgi:hypothetical protein
MLFSFINRDNLSGDMFIVDELKEEPKQNSIDQGSFSVSINKVDYEIQPIYEYELFGLVVSYELHDGDYSLHKRWNDHLNVADYCVVWDENASSEFLPKIDFWNGQFTCNFSTRNKEAWDDFNVKQLSNNHLISDDQYIRNKLRKINVGDQIRIVGWLSSYKNIKSGAVRGTSVSRDDQGNGACETIYVKEVSVLRDFTSIWRITSYLSLLVCIISLFLYFRAPHISRKS